MEKKYKFKLSSYLLDLSIIAIRSKKDIALLLMHTIKEILRTNPTETVTDDNDVAIIYIDKMKRIFYNVSNKIFSISFPFTISSDTVGNEAIYKISIYDIDIDNQLSSLLINIIDSIDDITLNDFENIASVVTNVCAEFGMTEKSDILLVQKLLSYIFFFDDGYFRCDYDETNEDEIYHPKNHIDFYYNNSSTFKIGLHKKIDINSSIDLVNINSPISYIEEKR